MIKHKPGKIMIRLTIISSILAGILLSTVCEAGILWGDAGIAIRSTSPSSPEGQVLNSKLIQSGDYLWILWTDTRFDPESQSGALYMQCINGGGELLLPADGIHLDDFGIIPDESAYGAVGDGFGGIIVGASNSSDPEIPKIMQKYSIEGEPQWASPIRVERMLTTQYMAPYANGGAILFAALEGPQMKLVLAGSNGSFTEQVIFNPSSSRSAIAEGIITNNSGFLVIGRIIHSANTNDLRYVSLDTNGNILGNSLGYIFFIGRVNTTFLQHTYNNGSLFLHSGENFTLVGQYFEPNGFPVWGLYGLTLVEEPVYSFQSCESNHCFWLQTTEFIEGQLRTGIQEYNQYGNTITDWTAIGGEYTVSAAYTPVSDNNGGLFTLMNTNETPSIHVQQFNPDGDAYEGYELPVPLDTTSFETFMDQSCMIWNDLLVSYRQDRYSNDNNGLYLQRIENIIVSEVMDETTPLPSGEIVINTYPEPFNHSVRLSFNSIHESTVQLNVFNILGQLRYSSTIPVQRTGVINVPLDLWFLSSGTYYIAIEQNGLCSTKRITLVR